MKITCISDTHGILPEIPECDLLIHAGDICPVNNHAVANQLDFLRIQFKKWLDHVPVKKTIIVPGNHDFVFEQNINFIPNNLKCSILIDDSITVDNIKIWGSPWQNWFLDWAFNADKNQSEQFLLEKYNKIPLDTDIIISHGPPYGYGDINIMGIPCGSKSLLDKIKEIKPKLVVTGHIHEGYGSYKIDNTTVINCSLLNEHYKLTNKPIVFEL